MSRVLQPHIDNRHGRQWAIQHAPLHDQACISTVGGILSALERRSGGPQYDECVFTFPAHDRDVATVISRRFLLLKGGIVLFVHDDEAEVRERCEYRRPGAHDNRHFAAPDAVPLIVSFAFGETAVLNGNQIAERLAKRRGDGGRQGNLRHENEHRPSMLQHCLSEPEIHLGLARPGYALEQGDGKLFRGGGRTERLEHGGLLFGERARRRPVHRSAHDAIRKWIALETIAAERDHAISGEALQHVCGNAARVQIGNGQSHRSATQKVDRHLLFRLQHQSGLVPLRGERSHTQRTVLLRRRHGGR